MDTSHFRFYIPISQMIALTEIKNDDRASLLEHLSEKEIFLQTFSMPYPYGDREADGFLQRMAEKLLTEAHPSTLAIRRIGDHKLIGVFGFHDLEEGHQVEIGYWIAKADWGQGIATQVVKHASRMAFEDFGVQRIHAKSFARNKASIRVLQKAGFQQEGLLKKAARKEEEFLDVALFGLLKS